MKDGSGGGKRSESDKEKTKMRERQRRAITTNIFHGLRKHGGYHLSSRADINEVLRELAKEAGWVVEPDGTTYRSKASNSCPLCGAVKTTSTTIANPMPTSSAVIGGGGRGECSTTASPRGAYVGDPLSNINVGSRSLICFPESFSGCHQPISVPVCTYQELSSDGGGRSGSGDAFLECSATAMGTTYEQQGQILHLEAPLRHFR